MERTSARPPRRARAPSTATVASGHGRLEGQPPALRSRPAWRSAGRRRLRATARACHPASARPPALRRARARRGVVDQLACVLTDVTASITHRVRPAVTGKIHREQSPARERVEQGPHAAALRDTPWSRTRGGPLPHASSRTRKPVWVRSSNDSATSAPRVAKSSASVATDALLERHDRVALSARPRSAECSSVTAASLASQVRITRSSLRPRLASATGPAAANDDRPP